MRGYWNDEAKTHETIDAARWLHSGDLGVMDADGPDMEGLVVG